jgi:tetratricopeptide (TPR) repeat protein
LKAIEIDDGIAGAYTLTAWSHFFDFLLLWSADFQASRRDAIEAARRAVQLDEADAQAHVVLTWAELFGRRFDIALVEAERAVEINPNLTSAYSARSGVSAFTGNPEGGIVDAERAIRLSPHDPLTFLALNELAICRYLLGDYAVGAETATRLVALKPDYLYGHVHLVCNCAQLGEMERAREAYREVRRILNGDIDRAIFAAMAPFKNPVDLERFLASFRIAGWEG